ncbi:hypothetical protein PCANC_00357 [Puccinia coronata f. sp. avenae]|uniref:Lipoprotein n=1 Tax=Puccinia coronata f. sp. avenae TaxID=200324 RepID=A0A2N5W9D8_9BASI|nr:hypothetical protein PCANC_00357 [Puccinia coronata f. sp. avenae]
MKSYSPTALVVLTALALGASCAYLPPQVDLGAAEGSKVSSTAGNNRSNTAVRAVLEQPCSTGGQTGTVRPKHLPPGRTGLSDQLLGPVGQDQPGPVGQICPTSWLLLWLDSARPTTGQTRLFEHRLNCRCSLEMLHGTGLEPPDTCNSCSRSQWCDSCLAAAAAGIAAVLHGGGGRPQ